MAVVLFAHGARKASWAEPFEALSQQLQTQLPNQRICLAYLELMSPSLEDVIAEMVGKGESEIVIIPLFLSRGGHIVSDLPVLLSQLQQQYPQLVFRTLPILLEIPEVQKALQKSIINSLS